MIDRHDQCYLVDIRGQNMTLFAEVGGFADNIVLAVLYLRDPVVLDLYIVTYGDGVGTTDSPDTEITFYPAFRIRTIVQSNDVTATRRFNNETSHP